MPRGCRLAGYCLRMCRECVLARCRLHRGIFTCATELCTGRKTDRHIRYCMERVETMIRYGVTPLLVFDGASLPAKKCTEVVRAASRAHALQAGKQLLASGNREAAHQQFTKAVDVSPHMQHDLMLVRSVPVRYGPCLLSCLKPANRLLVCPVLLRLAGLAAARGLLHRVPVRGRLAAGVPVRVRHCRRHHHGGLRRPALPLQQRAVQA